MMIISLSYMHSLPVGSFVESRMLTTYFSYLQNPSPNYNVTDMRVPMALFTGGHDWLADPTDVAKLLPMLNSTGRLFYHKNIKYYDHLDFIWGVDAPTVVYSDIIALAKKMKDDAT